MLFLKLSLLFNVVAIVFVSVAPFIIVAVPVIVVFVAAAVVAAVFVVAVGEFIVMIVIITIIKPCYHYQHTSLSRQQHLLRVLEILGSRRRHILTVAFRCFCQLLRKNIAN